jgi:hypothetical protein
MINQPPTRLPQEPIRVPLARSHPEFVEEILPRVDRVRRWTDSHPGFQAFEERVRMRMGGELLREKLLNVPTGQELDDFTASVLQPEATFKLLKDLRVSDVTGVLSRLLDITYGYLGEQITTPEGYQAFHRHSQNTLLGRPAVKYILGALRVLAWLIHKSPWRPFAPPLYSGEKPAEAGSVRPYFPEGFLSYFAQHWERLSLGSGGDIDCLMNGEGYYLGVLQDSKDLFSSHGYYVLAWGKFFGGNDFSNVGKPLRLLINYKRELLLHWMAHEVLDPRALPRDLVNGLRQLVILSFLGAATGESLPESVEAELVNRFLTMVDNGQNRHLDGERERLETWMTQFRNSKKQLVEKLISPSVFMGWQGSSYTLKPRVRVLAQDDQYHVHREAQFCWDGVLMRGWSPEAVHQAYPLPPSFKSCQAGTWDYQACLAQLDAVLGDQLLDRVRAELSAVENQDPFPVCYRLIRSEIHSPRNQGVLTVRDSEEVLEAEIHWERGVDVSESRSSLTLGFENLNHQGDSPSLSELRTWLKAPLLEEASQLWEAVGLPELRWDLGAIEIPLPAFRGPVSLAMELRGTGAQGHLQKHPLERIPGGAYFWGSQAGPLVLSERQVGVTTGADFAQGRLQIRQPKRSFLKYVQAISPESEETHPDAGLESRKPASPDLWAAVSHYQVSLDTHLRLGELLKGKTLAELAQTLTQLREGKGFLGLHPGPAPSFLSAMDLRFSGATSAELLWETQWEPFQGFLDDQLLHLLKSRYHSEVEIPLERAKKEAEDLETRLQGHRLWAHLMGPGNRELCGTDSLSEHPMIWALAHPDPFSKMVEVLELPPEVSETLCSHFTRCQQPPRKIMAVALLHGLCQDSQAPWTLLHQPYDPSKKEASEGWKPALGPALLNVAELLEPVLVATQRAYHPMATRLAELEKEISDLKGVKAP